ncbi:GNAT family N-acetyltransferase [Paenibacillus pini]|uniref:Acetyltransferase n=1 Tax=Paenibacillus pini JCM 16418 TaxID=1236976 RepID=W7YNA0_9BACL|nr:GNAT family N-acetyltransferase [Paenibacillus pini]GAF06101.1 acetyltransferase [Paenibacillus pini JCM 16418]
MFLKPMDELYASDIATWKYEVPYDLYDMDEDDESIQELMHYQCILRNDQLIGYFCTGEYAQVPLGHSQWAYPEFNSIIDLGFGMKPELTGQGLGYEFITFIIQEVRHQYDPSTIRLTVATFNKRAIQLYTRVGFVKESSFLTNNNEFWVMTKPFV